MKEMTVNQSDVKNVMEKLYAFFEDSCIDKLSAYAAMQFICKALEIENGFENRGLFKDGEEIK